jgi:hypothetical protein
LAAANLALTPTPVINFNLPVWLIGAPSTPILADEEGPTMPVRHAVSLLPPISIDRVPELLRQYGVRVSVDRLREAAVAGQVPAHREGRRWVVDDADLDTLATYFRDHPVQPCRQGAGALAQAGRQ